jgi:hypothetical protein
MAMILAGIRKKKLQVWPALHGQGDRATLDKCRNFRAGCKDQPCSVVGSRVAFWTNVRECKKRNVQYPIFNAQFSVKNAQ